MISILGRFAVLIALGACGIGAVSGIAAGRKNSEEAWKVSRLMAYLAFFAMSFAIIAMEYALFQNDFSVSYVAEVGSSKTPHWVTAVSLWSSLDGSILLWGLVLSAYTAAFAYLTKGKFVEHAPWALGVSQLIGLFFYFLVAGVANPFLPTAEMAPNELAQLCQRAICKDGIVTEGPGPNPLLQNHILMVIHPPALYLGYVGMSVPFGMGAASLFAGKIGAAWSQALRRWVLVPWGFLTIGIMLGGWWSYEVLGWGGYWAWDPVENASFLPWLTATAFLHSALIMERRDRLKGWAICLLLVTFLLTLLGTFMTRSGVFNSVHSFTKTPIGPVFLVFLAICTFFSLVLLALRVDTLIPKKESENPGLVSRESAFLLNNLLFAAFTFTVLLGTVYPLLFEALTEKKLSIGAPYFDQLGIPICIAIVFMMGVGPALPWGKQTASSLVQRLVYPGVAALLTGIASFVIHPEVGWAHLSFAVCAFAFAVTLREFYEPAHSLMKKKQIGFLTALWTVVSRARRRFGGYIVHIGVIMVAVAITGSGAYKVEKEFILTPGQKASFQGYELTFVKTRTDMQPHRRSEVAEVAVSYQGRELGNLEPRLNQYFGMGTTIGTPAVRTGLDEDLYLNLVKIEKQRIGLQVIVEPMMLWLWLGGGVMGLGTMVSAWPRRRRKEANLKENAA